MPGVRFLRGASAGATKAGNQALEVSPTGSKGDHRGVDFTYNSASCRSSTETGAPVIWSVPWLRLGERDDVPQRRGAREQHRQAVHAQRDTTVGRRAGP